MTTTQESSTLDGYKLEFEETPDTPHKIKVPRAYHNYFKDYFSYLVEVILA